MESFARRIRNISGSQRRRRNTKAERDHSFHQPSAENEALTSALFFGDLGDAEFFLHVLKRDALGFRVADEDDEKLQGHHG